MKENVDLVMKKHDDKLGINSLITICELCLRLYRLNDPLDEIMLIIERKRILINLVNLCNSFIKILLVNFVLTWVRCTLVHGPKADSLIYVAAKSNEGIRKKNIEDKKYINI
ncbi:hypothetical protein BpHYR1_032637 [Brachionus plicatilis]|uniref:Uncharacterized protein n=1 Tax=Brachionus plicatilis TaxID=10195 RepID=A0A3M7Q3T8_BRAPC|nr:hypothetical protein BpHYR1_032637 [Brachionus plicatilis]